jgi:folate-binding Fe-S cluster repair protein YgfZ
MGQEVVARTKFLGKNKRALYILQSNKPLDAENIKPGALLEKSIGDNWRRGGVIVRSSSNSKSTKLLAVLANDTQEDDVLRLKGSMETLRVLPLPYSVDA